VTEEKDPSAMWQIYMDLSVSSARMKDHIWIKAKSPTGDIKIKNGRDQIATVTDVEIAKYLELVSPDKILLLCEYIANLKVRINELEELHRNPYELVDRATIEDINKALAGIRLLVSKKEPAG
jgi:hypothetical protein